MLNEEYREVTLKVKSVVMDYVREVSSEGSFTVEEIIKGYVEEILDFYISVKEKRI